MRFNNLSIGVSIHGCRRVSYLSLPKRTRFPAATAQDLSTRESISVLGTREEVEEVDEGRGELRRRHDLG
jgi:hypothetical protein